MCCRRLAGLVLVLVSVSSSVVGQAAQPARTEPSPFAEPGLLEPFAPGSIATVAFLETEAEANALEQPPPSPTVAPGGQPGLAELGAAVAAEEAAIKQLAGAVQQLGSALRVTTGIPRERLILFGTLSGEMLFSDDRPLLPSAPAFLTPDFGLDQSTAEIHGKSTALGALLMGPQIGSFQSGGVVLIYFFGETVLFNTSGVFFAQGYGELKNDAWRFAFGLQQDIVNPQNPTTLNWAVNGPAGNIGFLRGQLRAERFIKPNPYVQWTLTTGLSQPVTTQFSAFDEISLTESNGWPNAEGRLSLGLGPLQGQGPAARRPAEAGVSGMIGELRTTSTVGNVPVRQIVDDAWAVGLDGRVRLTDRFGMQGELFRGRGIGTYMGAIAQSINFITLETIQTQGGWGEVYYYLNPCLHTHLGYGVDNPDDDDLAPAQRTRNEVIFANLIWDVTAQFQVGFEVSHWDTDYVLLPDNDAMVYHTRVQLKF